MELNSKKLEKTSNIIYYTISFILCVFLILLSGRIIDDLDTTTTRPLLANFGHEKLLKDLNSRMEALNVDIENISSKKLTIEKTIATARQNYANEKASFDNWLQTRKTLGSPDKDQEVTQRAKKLDEFYAVEQEWRTELNARQDEIDLKLKQQAAISKQIEKENEAAYVQYDSAIKKYELKVFLIRLLFVAPILALGIFFFVKYRKHKFWPLYFGFTLFSLYAFFFGLVPYLPSYGGYVRYAVGIILSLGLGYYAIKSIRQYLERKQAELKTSTEERAKNVQLSVAEKALDNHYCPSCGKDFILKKWEFPSKANDSETYKFVTNFCRHCGLELFKDCVHCHHQNFAHLPYCSKCGTHLSA